MMAGLIALNASLILFTDANFPWVVFPFVGWSIGLTSTACTASAALGVRSAPDRRGSKIWRSDHASPRKALRERGLGLHSGHLPICHTNLDALNSLTSVWSGRDVPAPLTGYR
jgi:hypothetical protein